MLRGLRDDLSSITKIQSETKNPLTEIKNNFQGNNSGVHEAENQINDLEHKTTNQNKRRKRIQKNEDSISSLWDNSKKFNVHVIGVPEREEKEQEI